MHLSIGGSRPTQSLRTPYTAELGFPIRPGGFLLPGPIALLTGDLLVSAALWAMLHHGDVRQFKTARKLSGAASRPRYSPGVARLVLGKNI